MVIMLNRKRLIVPGVIVAVVLGWMLVDYLWVTDEDKIEAALDQLQRAAGEGDADGLLRGVSRDFRVEGMDYAQFADAVRRYFSLAGPTYVRYLRQTIAVTGSLAVADVIVFSQPEEQRNLYYVGRSRWVISFRRYGEDWRTIAVEPVQFESRRVNGWGAVRRRLDR